MEKYDTRHIKNRKKKSKQISLLMNDDGNVCEHMLSHNMFVLRGNQEDHWVNSFVFYLIFGNLSFN